MKFRFLSAHALHIYNDNSKSSEKTAGKKTDNSLQFHKFPTPLFQKAKKKNKIK